MTVDLHSKLAMALSDKSTCCCLICCPFQSSRSSITQWNVLVRYTLLSVADNVLLEYLLCRPIINLQSSSKQDAIMERK